MKHYAIIGNYRNSIKTAYVPGWDLAFSKDGLPTMTQVEDYLCSVVDDTNYSKLLVKHGKLLAKQIGIRASDATAILVNEQQKAAIEQHFAPEISKTLWILDVDSVSV
jgi:hypothetical protein